MGKHHWPRGLNTVKISIPPNGHTHFTQFSLTFQTDFCGFRQDDPTTHMETAEELKIPKIVLGMRTEWEDSL